MQHVAQKDAQNAQIDKESVKETSHTVVHPSTTVLKNQYHSGTYIKKKESIENESTVNRVPATSAGDTAGSENGPGSDPDESKNSKKNFSEQKNPEQIISELQADVERIAAKTDKAVERKAAGGGADYEALWKDTLGDLGEAVQHVALEKHLTKNLGYGPNRKL